MYLKSLVLIGFKSFAHKTVINFHRGITAIVGPNGCGKSNILDSIRWVLGEQSAKALRGDEMADVIFSGTDSKLAVGMAEVSLTFADCEKDLKIDYNEVSITRRVFRDGSSNYLLNNVVCRLKDIQMLFMDTGVGRLAYSIMEQGKIDLILSSRPEDRRVIFEEAAGITKYKTQKREALRKLENTDANLIRLTDITREVKRQIGSLQRQAAKAKRYKRLFEDLRTLDIHLAHRSYHELKDSIAVLHDQIDKLIESQKSIEQQIESEESGLSLHRLQLENLDAAIDAVHRTIREHQSQVDKAVSRIGLNQERIQEASELIRRYEDDLASSEEKLGIQQSQLQKTDGLLTEISRSLETEEVQLSERQTDANASKDKRQMAEHLVKDIQRAIQQKESQVATLKGNLSSLCNQREAGKARLDLLENEIIQGGATKRDLKTHVEKVRLELEKAQTGLQSIRDDLNHKEHILLTRQQQSAELDKELSLNRKSLGERESRLEILKLLNEEGAGLGAGSQAILKGLGDTQIPRAAILGAFANYIEVNNTSIVAIEAALSQHLQAIVISDLAAAEQIISQVIERKIGRAAVLAKSFLPKNEAVQTEPLPDQAEAWALDQVVCQPEVASLVSRVLKDVVIARDISSAIAIKNQFSDLAIATLNGDLVSREGVVFAGAGTENGNSILQRKSQIKLLQDESEKIQNLIANLEERHKELTAELEFAQQNIRACRGLLQRNEVDASSLQGQLSMLDREAREIDGKVESLMWERDEVRARLKAANGEVESLEEELIAGTHKLQVLYADLEQAQAEANHYRHHEEALLEALSNLKIRLVTERQRKENLQSQRHPMVVRLSELREFIATCNNDISNYSARMEHFRNENEDLERKIFEQQTDQSKTEAEGFRLQHDRTTFFVSIEAVEATLRHLRKKLSESHGIRGQHEVRLAQFSLQLDNRREHVSRRYQLELSTFQPDWPAFSRTFAEQRLEKRLPGTQGPDELANKVLANDELAKVDWQVVESTISEMIERLDGMGPVNLEAIQEYDELEERQRFLEGQIEDLTKSKNELLEVISKINATTKDQFQRTFSQIQNNFEEVFRELFGGGKGTLLLVDDLDPLESGIEIVAKPPGKQLQSISLLSGGEKTMTAVALLFAIYMIKPSPFCVLDEMDAPLDESNIGRFILILDRFVNQSQFVVITHNKKTIAKADVLYGVTMEEHGISKLVGVRLSKNSESPEETFLMNG